MYFLVLVTCIVLMAGKTLLSHTNLFSPNEYKKNGKIIYKYFEEKYGKTKLKS